MTRRRGDLGRADLAQADEIATAVRVIATVVAAKNRRLRESWAASRDSRVAICEGCGCLCKPSEVCPGCRVAAERRRASRAMLRAS